MNNIAKSFKHLIACALVCISGAAMAQLRVEISGVGSNQIPIAIATFADEAQAPASMSAIITADLERSGAFKIVDANTTLSDGAAIDYAAWKARGVDALVVGSVQRLADGRFDVRYKLIDTIKSAPMSSLDNTVQPKYTRLAAHKIADDIFEKLTGTRGAFSTRIAYVEQRGARDYRLKIADADGEGALEAVSSSESIFSPSWSPDGTRLTYVAIAEKRKPVIYLHDVRTGVHRIIANEKGSNSAPSWSRDGRMLAMALSRDGHTQVYTMNVDGSGLRRVSNSNGIDTEPQFSADGQSLYFTSDRSGAGQVYKMSINGGEASRVTFASNSENFSPRLSSDGKTLAYISRREGNYGLYVMDLSTKQELRLADSASEPSFSPNGKYILFATTAGGRKTLSVVSVDGRVKQNLSTQAGNIREPSWGPFMN